MNIGRFSIELLNAEYSTIGEYKFYEYSYQYDTISSDEFIVTSLDFNNESIIWNGEERCLQHKNSCW